jgi:hypothetical protein
VSTGAAAVTGYRVYRNAGDGSMIPTVNATSACTVANPLNTQCMASGLTAGHTYKFTVVATSSVGEGGRSSTLSIGTALASVINLTTTAVSTTQINLTWMSPMASTASLQAVSYLVYRNDGTTGSTVSIVCYNSSGSTGAATRATVTGLQGGWAYTFQVVAVNVGGEGVRSSTFVQSTAPAAPTGLTSTASDHGSVSLRWLAPAQGTGAPATGYIVYRNDGTAGSAVATQVSQGSVLTAVASGLAPGRLYTFAVSATSIVGEGERSATLGQSTAPGTAGALSSTGQTATSISLSWAPPVSDSESGLNATGYYVYDVTASSPVLVYNGAGSTTLHATVSNLQGGRNYSFAVSASSPAGQGVPGAAFIQSTAPGPVPAFSVASSTSDSISLQWTAPSVTTGAAVTGYRVYYDGATSGSPVYDGTDNTATSAVLTNLSSGVEIRCVVVALSSAGMGTASDVVAASTTPPAPTTVAPVTQTTTSVTL